MKTFATDRPSMRLLLFLNAGGQVSHWQRHAPGQALEQGRVDAHSLPSAADIWLIVPADEMTISFVPLPSGLTEAQATAAVRLKLADQSAEAIGDLHVAVGPEEAGGRPVARLRPERMEAWLEAAKAAGAEPTAIVPAPMLIPPPETGYRRLGHDYRSEEAAFAAEPELAGYLVGDAPVETAEEEQIIAEAMALDRAPLNLRQGAFALRRASALATWRMSRIAIMLLLIAGLTLAIQVATLIGYTFAADRLEAEAEQLAAAPGTSPPFATSAAILFDAVRNTPNVELIRIEHGEDGRLSASLFVDSPATLDLLRRRLETSALQVRTGALRNSGGRPAVNLVLGAS